MTRCNSEMEGAGVAGFNFTSDDVGGAPFPHALPGMLALSRRACGCLAVPPAGRMQHVRCVCVCTRIGLTLFLCADAVVPGLVEGSASRDGLGNEVFDVTCCYCDTRLRAPWVRPRPRAIRGGRSIEICA
jgi:hypothetical protein